MKVAHLSEPAEERVVFRDGLGVRERRETNTGEVVEWFHLDPAFAGAEQPLRERVTRLAKLQHVKFARIFGLEPAIKGRGPILISSHVAGPRLAEALEMAGHGLITFDPGTGLQVTREVLGGLAVLHDSRNVAHGALGPERVVLTSTGRVVMVEHVLANALDRLQRPRHQLWRDWRIPTPPAAGPARLDMQTDLAQAGLLALAALLGRPLDEDEYPHRLRGLLPLAQDRLARSPAAGIAGDVVAWLERLAPVDSRRAFKTVREAQQALEELVSGRTSAMGVIPTRVKGVVAAVTAISAAPAAAPEAPLSAGATPIVVAPAPDQSATSSAAPACAVPTRPPASPASDLVTADADIDIDALLRLEAELEGGTSPAVPAVARPPAPSGVPSAPVASSTADESSLEALALERLVLERQFAELVATVAPQDDAPIHLIPEVPATSEPLVAAQVLWSSMPADDLAEVIEAPLDGDIISEVLPATVADAEPLLPARAQVGEWNALAMDLGEPAVEPSVALSENVPSPVKPAEDAPPLLLPSAAIDHVPAEWWTEALPWRAGDHVAAADAVAAVAEAVPSATMAAPALDAVDEALPEQAETETAAVNGDPGMDDVEEACAEGAATGVGEPGVGEDFGYLSLDDIDGRAAVAEAMADVDPVHEECQQDAWPSEMTSPADVVQGAEIEGSAEGVELADVAVVAEAALVDEAPHEVDARTSSGLGEHAPVVPIASASPLVPQEHAEAEPWMADLPAALSPADDAPMLAGTDEGIETLSAEGLVDDGASPVAVSDVCASDTVYLDDISPSSSIDVSIDADETSGGDEAVAPAFGERPGADGEPSGLREDTGAGHSAADLSPDVHAAEDSPVWAGIDEALDTPVSGCFLPDDEATAADADAARLETTEVPDVAPVWGLDASVHADGHLGGDEATAPAGEYRLFADIVPVVLQEDAGVEWPMADTPFGMNHVDDAPVTAAASLLAREAAGDATPDWREAFVGGPSAAGPLTEAPRTGPAGELDAMLPVLDTHVGPPMAFQSLDMPVESTAAPAAVVAPDAGFEPEPMLESVAVHVSVPEETTSEAPSSDPAHALVQAPLPEAEPEPEFEHAPALLTEAEPEYAPVLSGESEPDLELTSVMAAESEPESVPEALPEPSPHEAAVTEPPAATPELVPEVVIVDDVHHRDTWDDLPSEAPMTPAQPESAADDVVWDAEVEPAAEDGAGHLAPGAASVSAASVSKKKKKRSRRKKAPQAEIQLETPPMLALAVPAPQAPAPTPADDDGQSAAVRASSLLAREVPAWTPPADLGMRRAPAAAPVPEPAVLPEVSHVPPPLSVASTVEVLRSVSVPVPQPVPPAPDMLRAFEQEIRAVGMPDLEDLAPRSTRATLPSMADGTGPATGSVPRVVPFDPRGVPPAPEAARGMNWRRLVAASVLIALFQGAAFAAWWWVQPGARGTLVVQTSKIGVEVLLDNKVVGRTPFREEVAPGRHTLGLRQGSTVREMPVEISVGVVTTQAIDWPSLAGGRGNLQVTSNPAGAKVFANGKPLGEAPLLLEDLPAGDQVLTLRSDAGSVTVTATVVADETTPLEVKIFAGWILVDAPVEVNLLLNGREKIGSSMDGQILLPPGTHRVQAVNEALGIRQWFSVTVEPGAVRRVPFSVAPATLALQEEAEVFVDGMSAGTTPGTIRIAPGTHDIAIRPVSGPERRQAMTVRAGQRVEF